MHESTNILIGKQRETKTDSLVLPHQKELYSGLRPS